jgi:hypothetical protein
LRSTTVNLGLTETLVRLLEWDRSRRHPILGGVFAEGEISGRSREVLKRGGLSHHLVSPIAKNPSRIPVATDPSRRLERKYYLGLIYWGCGGRTRRCGCSTSKETVRTMHLPTCAAPISRRTQTPEGPWQTMRKRIPSTRKTGRNSAPSGRYYSGGNDTGAMKLALEASADFPTRISSRSSWRQLFEQRPAPECYSVLENATILPSRDNAMCMTFCPMSICLAMEAMKKGRYDEASSDWKGRRIPRAPRDWKPQDPDFRIQDYLTMFTWDKRGHPKAVKKHKENCRVCRAPFPWRNETVKARVEQWYRSPFRTERARRSRNSPA